MDGETDDLSEVGEVFEGAAEEVLALYDDAVHRRKFRSRCVLALLAQGHHDLHRVQYRTMELEAFVFDGGELPDGADDGPDPAEIEAAVEAALDDAEWPTHRDLALLERWCDGGQTFRQVMIELHALAEAWGVTMEAVGARLSHLVRGAIENGHALAGETE